MSRPRTSAIASSCLIANQPLGAEPRRGSDCPLMSQHRMPSDTLENRTPAFVYNPRLTTLSDRSWESLRTRAEIAKAISALPPGKRARAVEEGARRAKVSKATLYRDLAKFNGTVGDLIGLKPGCPAGSTKLLAEVREIVRRHLEDSYLRKERRSLQSVVRKIREECAARALPAPAYSTVARAVTRLDQIMVARRRGEDSKARSMILAPGSYDITTPMSVWQIDHTKLDVIIVSEVNRIPIGRAWVTFIIDVASRMIAGFYLTLESPSRHTVAKALINAVMPKEKYLRSLNVVGVWPIFGLPRALHSDNAAEFRPDGVYGRACENHFIKVILRQVGKPHHGGHIERLIGSMMGRAKLLPGATKSNPKERGSYNSVKQARMSFRDVERWLAEQVIDYHSARHSTLGRPPLVEWRELCRQQRIVCEPPAHPDAFYRDFLPEVSVKIGRRGFHWKTLNYCGPVVQQLVRSGERSVTFKYDPSDLSQVFVRLGEAYHAVGLNYPGSPQITLWEVQCELARRRECKAGPSTSALTVAGILNARVEELDQPSRERQSERLKLAGISLGKVASSSKAGAWGEFFSSGGRHD